MIKQPITHNPEPMTLCQRIAAGILLAVSGWAGIMILYAAYELREVFR